MTKITVYRYDEMNSPVEAQGWFTLEDAEAMPEADPMTAARHAQAMRRGESALGVKETLYHTSQGPGFSRPLGISMIAAGLLKMNRMATRVLGVALAISS
jgi:hypothetical protein